MTTSPALTEGSLEQSLSTPGDSMEATEAPSESPEPIRTFASDPPTEPEVVSIMCRLTLDLAKLA